MRVQASGYGTTRAHKFQLFSCLCLLASETAEDLLGRPFLATPPRAQLLHMLPCAAVSFLCFRCSIPAETQLLDLQRWAVATSTVTYTIACGKTTLVITGVIASFIDYPCELCLVRAGLAGQFGAVHISKARSTAQQQIASPPAPESQTYKVPILKAPPHTRYGLAQKLESPNTPQNSRSPAYSKTWTMLGALPAVLTSEAANSS